MEYEQYEEQFVGGKQFKRKNTKKWCKGKKGREHQPVTKLNNKYTYSNRVPNPCGKVIIWADKVACYHHVVCEKCGKELKFTPDVCPTTGLARKDRAW